MAQPPSMHRYYDSPPAGYPSVDRLCKLVVRHGRSFLDIAHHHLGRRVTDWNDPAAVALAKSCSHRWKEIVAAELLGVHTSSDDLVLAAILRATSTSAPDLTMPDLWRHHQLNVELLRHSISHNSFVKVAELLNAAHPVLGWITPELLPSSRLHQATTVRARNRSRATGYGGAVIAPDFVQAAQFDSATVAEIRKVAQQFGLADTPFGSVHQFVWESALGLRQIYPDLPATLDLCAARYEIEYRIKEAQTMCPNLSARTLGTVLDWIENNGQQHLQDHHWAALVQQMGTDNVTLIQILLVHLMDPKPLETLAEKLVNVRADLFAVLESYPEPSDILPLSFLPSTNSNKRPALPSPFEPAPKRPSPPPTPLKGVSAPFSAQRKPAALPSAISSLYSSPAVRAPAATTSRVTHPLSLPPRPPSSTSTFNREPLSSNAAASRRSASSVVPSQPRRPSPAPPPPPRPPPRHISASPAPSSASTGKGTTSTPPPVARSVETPVETVALHSSPAGELVPLTTPSPSHNPLSSPPLPGVLSPTLPPFSFAPSPPSGPFVASPPPFDLIATPVEPPTPPPPSPTLTDITPTPPPPSSTPAPPPTSALDALASLATNSEELDMSSGTTVVVPRPVTLAEAMRALRELANLD